MIREIEALSDSRAEHLAASQGLRSAEGLRSAAPAQTRQKLLETALTLRQMSRIQNAGKK